MFLNQSIFKKNRLIMITLVMFARLCYSTLCTRVSSNRALVRGKDAYRIGRKKFLNPKSKSYGETGQLEIKTAGAIINIISFLVFGVLILIIAKTIHPFDPQLFLDKIQFQRWNFWGLYLTGGYSLYPI